MYQIQVHRFVNKMMSILYRVRLWSREVEETVWERRIKIFYLIFYSLFPVSLMAGVLKSDNIDELVFSLEMMMASVLLLVKMWNIIWRKKEFLELLEYFCNYSIDDKNTFDFVNKELQFLMNCVAVLFVLCCSTAIIIIFILPFIGNERTLFLNIGFPFDYKNGKFAYWGAHIIISTQLVLSIIVLISSALIWYLMFNCGLQHVVLKDNIINMGSVKQGTETSKRRKVTYAERENSFRQDLHGAITEHQHLIESTYHLHVFLSKFFEIQLATTALSICGSVYCLAFNRGDNLFESMIHLATLLYHVFDIFMVMFFGNKIKSGSDRLSYSLFESDWVGRSQSIKKDIIVFGEFLMKPMELVFFKLYPVTLETFTRVIKSAYSMFNILKTFK